MGPFKNGLRLTSPATSPVLPDHCHVSNHVIDVNYHVISHVIDMAVKSMTNIVLFVMFIFVIKNGLGLDFGGPRTVYDGFKTSWIKQSMMIF